MQDAPAQPDPGHEEAASVTPALAGMIEQLLTAIEQEAGWDLTRPKTRVEIVRESAGEFRVYANARLLVRT